MLILEKKSVGIDAFSANQLQNNDKSGNKESDVLCLFAPAQKI